MIRLIKRYGSRKLYDTEESRYVSLDELADWIRSGQEVRVVDNDSGDDVTTQTLAQVILEQGKTGAAPIPSEVFHELIRSGGRRLREGAAQVQHNVDRFVQSSLEKLGPVREARREMEALRARLEQLEGTLDRLEESAREGGSPPQRKAAPKKATAARQRATGRTAERSSREKRGTGKKKRTTKKKVAKKKVTKKKTTKKRSQR